MEKICMYLRKSRADEEAEKRGEGETLTKHKKALLKIATSHKLNIVKIREEIVSGESLVHRPQMLKLLKEVKNNEYDAILCMDLDRLGRGNMQEQGLILETFKKSNTKIITPRKIYDLHDEFDEEYSEFEAFMARKELKIINRRLQSGRIRSIEEGNYLSPLPPYGYKICYTQNARTLKPHPKQTPVVKIIFDLYTTHHLGCNKIAHKLNLLGYKTYKNKDWSGSSVLNIIKNPIYIGKICWKKKEIKKSPHPHQLKTTRTRPKNEWIIVDGKHPSLISEETFEWAQKLLKTKYHVPYHLHNHIVNPLAGLIKCKKCGASMILRSYKNKDAQIMCYAHCGNKSSKLKYVEQHLIDALYQWLSQYETEYTFKKNMDHSIQDSINLYKTILKKLYHELSELRNQKEGLHDFLERKIYDVPTYMKRSLELTKRIDLMNNNINDTQKQLEHMIKKSNLKNNIFPKIENILDVYHHTLDPEKKNILLKSILNYAIYSKEKNQRNDAFTLTLYPKLPFHIS